MKRIDWTSVDLTRPTDELLRELGCAESTLRAARSIMGVKRPDKNSGGFREGSGRPLGATNKNHQETAGISIRIPKTTLDRCRELASERGQSISKTIGELLGEFFNGSKKA